MEEDACFELAQRMASLQPSATLAMASIPVMPRMQSLSNAISKTALKLKGVLMHMYMRSDRST